VGIRLGIDIIRADLQYTSNHIGKNFLFTPRVESIEENIF